MGLSFTRYLVEKVELTCYQTAETAIQTVKFPPPKTSRLSHPPTQALRETPPPLS